MFSHIYFSVSFGIYVLEILIGPLLTSLRFVEETDLILLGDFDLDLDTFFTLVVLGIFNFKFEAVYSAN